MIQTTIVAGLLALHCLLVQASHRIDIDISGGVLANPLLWLGTPFSNN